MTDPCLPALHTPATLQSWATWRAARPWWRPAAIVVGCAAAVGVPVAVFYPYAPQPPVIAVPVLAPLPSAGGVGQGFYVPPREGSEFSPYLPGAPELTDSTTSSQFGEFSPNIAVPEPASLALLAVGAGGAVLVRRRRG